VALAMKHLYMYIFLLPDWAKIHMTKWEWDRALFNLNRTL
jgi:hypothetical protein